MPEDTQAIADEPRIVRETGIDARIAAIVEPVVVSMGCRLVRVRLSGRNGLTLQIMAERRDGAMTVTDCEALSRALSPALDVENPIDRAYHLEVSSPGIDRPLARRSDFECWNGRLCACELAQPLAGRKRWRGRIGPVEAGHFVLECDSPSGDGSGGVVRIPFKALASARLVLTDALLKETRPGLDAAPVR